MNLFLSFFGLFTFGILTWVVFNIQKPAREQLNREILGKD